MRRILFEIPLFGSDLPIHAYGFMIMVGFLVALHVALRRARTVGIADEHVYDLSMLAIAGGVLGARLFHVAENAGDFDFGFATRNAGLGWSGYAAGALAGLAAGIAGSGNPRKLSRVFLFAALLVLLKIGAVLSTRIGATYAVLAAGGWSLLDLAFAGYLAHGAWKNRGRIRERVSAWGESARRRLAGALAALAWAAGGAYVASRYRYAGEFDWSAFAIWEGGLVFYGGFLLATAATIAAMKAKRLQVLATADVLAPSVAVGLAFTRFGCYLNGCCWGKACGSFLLGLRYPEGSPPARQPDLAAGDWTVPTYPTQFLCSAGALLIFLALTWYYPRRRANGEIFCLFGLLYAVQRFFVEFLRHDTWITRPVKSVGLTTSQYVGLVLFVAAGGGLIALRGAAARRARQARVVEASA
ncbi:MAG: prolipoprotein diacylglyceryl transferase [Planctomycetes bacterium]|nr:prolipoprotein diacylglyceryl transferase [Planctomycetota bacterium]